jgi:hypothetical protein
VVARNQIAIHRIDEGKDFYNETMKKNIQYASGATFLILIFALL